MDYLEENIKKVHVSTKEREQILLTAFLIGFIFSFSKAGEDFFVFEIWLRNFVIYFIMGALTLIIMTSILKYILHLKGYNPIFKQSNFNYILSLLVTISSGGLFTFFLPGYFDVDIKKLKRAGISKKESINLGEVANSMYISIAILLIIATIMKLIFPNVIKESINPLSQFFQVVVYFVIFSILPLPFNNGIFLFFENKLKYITLFVFFLLYGLTLLRDVSLNFTTIIFIILLTGVIVYAYQKYFE